MAIRALLIPVPLEADIKFPTVPDTIRIEADGEDPAILSAEMLYRKESRGRTYDPYATPRWECSLKWSDGRIASVAFRPGRPDPKPAFDELMEFFTTVTLFAENLEDGDRRRLGMLIFGKTLLSFWRSDERWLRPTLTPPYPDSFV